MKTSDTSHGCLPAPKVDRPVALSDVVDAFPAAVAVVGRIGELRHANPAFCQLFDTGLDMLTGQSLAMLFDGAKRLFDAGQDHCDLVLHAATGKSLRVRANLSECALDGEGGDRLLQIVPIEDVMRALDDVGKSETRWKYALDSALQGVWDHDFEANELYYSATWKALRGLPADAVIDGSLDLWIESVHPDDRAHVLACIARQDSGAAAFNSFQYRERHADGRWIWIESRGSSVKWSEDGKPLRIIGTDTDITERKNAEAQLETISRRLQLALDVSKIGVFDFDIDACKLVWDDRMCEIYGVDPVTYGERRDIWESLLHPDDAEAASARVSRAIEQKTGFTNAYRIVRPDGEIRHIRASTGAYRDENGHRRFVGANWDVTDDIRLQNELTLAKTLAEARNAELEAARIRIEYNSLHDHLTGLPNRRYLDERLVDGGSDHSGVLHIDLDRFKQINDTLGHKAGDVMLVHTAMLLRSFAAKSDFVARIGGDEFVFLCGLDRDEADMARLSSDIIEALRQPVPYKAHICRFGASIGIAEATGADPKQMLVNADIALYRAKSLGRNRYAFFSQDIQAQILHSKRVADDILDGLDAGEFIPFYQPQFCARTLKISGVETLVRWKHPTKGLLAPDQFLAVAADINVLATIDRKIVEQASRDFRLWQAKGLPIPKFSVNVSARRLREPDIAQTMAAMDIEPGTLSFELLESIFLDDLEDAAIDTIAALKALGIDIEIDDFGTGHASIVGLLKLRPKRLKIDRALVNPITVRADQRQLVTSIIDIGHSLDIEVVAEGVETMEHVEILRALDCDTLQGYALARPMANADLERFAAAHRPVKAEPVLTRRKAGSLG